MKNILLLLALITIAMVATARAQDADSAKLIKEFRGQEDARQRSAEELDRDYQIAIKALAQKLGGADNYGRGEAAGALEGMVNQATRPGAQTQRAALSKAMAKSAKEEKPRLARVWLLRLIERAGREEVVPTLVELMGDDDELVRQHALMALANNPSEQAAEKLRDALEDADSYGRVAIINALGYRREPRSVAVLAKWTEDFDERVAAAAVAALGDIANAEARAAIEKLEEPDKEESLEKSLDAYLRVLEGDARGEGASRAATFYQQLYKNAAQRHWKLAGVRRLALGQDKAKASEVLLEALKSGEQQVQMAAAQLAADAGADVGTKVLERFDELPATAKAAVLDALAARGIAGTKEKALASISAEDAAVRRAALAALGSVGDAATAVMLASVASQRTGSEQSAARESIATIRGTDVDQALMGALEKSEPKIKSELVRGLAARRAASALPTLEKLARKDADSSVRVEAIKALGVMAPPGTLPSVLDILLASKDQKESEAAESAAAAIVARIDSPADRAAPLLNVLPKTTGNPRMAILRLLGRTGSADALAALRKELKEGDPAMRNATVRALADWPDVAAADDLLQIAREDQSNTNKVLALRGYVRIVALPSDRRPSATARMLGDALKIAPAGEKKAVLGALGAVPAPEALQLTAPLMEDEAVRNEAITASLRIARAVAGAVPDEATVAAKRAMELSQDEAVKRNAQATLQAAERSRDFITQWMVAGPYMEEGKDKSALFDIAFPPEKGGDAEWKRMPRNPDRSRFWEMNIDAVPSFRGNDRAAYLRTELIVPAAQELQLEVGSDDAIKVWVNGQLVHANNASRGNEQGQDKVKIKLNEGSNTILLKVINGGGGWGANARLRTLDDKKVTGMRVKAE